MRSFRLQPMISMRMILRSSSFFLVGCCSLWKDNLERHEITSGSHFSFVEKYQRQVAIYKVSAKLVALLRDFFTRRWCAVCRFCIDNPCRFAIRQWRCQIQFKRTTTVSWKPATLSFSLVVAFRRIHVEPLFVNRQVVFHLVYKALQVFISRLFFWDEILRRFSLHLISELHLVNNFLGFVRQPCAAIFVASSCCENYCFVSAFERFALTLRGHFLLPRLPFYRHERCCWYTDEFLLPLVF